jgi:hypothetical protein
VDFIYRKGSIQRVEGMPLGHPFLVGPVKILVPDDGSSAGRFFGMECQGVSLIHLIAAVSGYYMEFIQCPRSDLGNKTFPYAGLFPGHKLMGEVVPAVEITDNTYFFGVGCPDRKICPPDASSLHKMGPQLLIETIMLAFVKEVKVILA